MRLRFAGQVARYVRERTWHPTQTTEAAADGGLIVALEVSHLREVERWVLSWGPGCTVLEPEELRRRVATALAEAVAAYAPRGRGAAAPVPRQRRTGPAER